MPFKRWLPNFMLALLGVAILATFPVKAEEGCYPLEIISAQIEQLPYFRILQGEPLLRAVAIFNATPPASDIPWPAAYFAIRPDGYGVLMVGEAGTVCDGVLIVPSMVRKTLDVIDGVTA